VTVHIAGFALGGTTADGRESWSLPAMPIESRVMAVGPSQRVIEDMQFLGMVQAAQRRGLMGPIDSYARPDQDPPDLIVRTGENTFAVELTTISVTDVSRQRFQEVQRFSQDLMDRVRADLDTYAHLRGRTIFLGEMASDDNRPPRRNSAAYDALMTELCTALADDFGTVEPYSVPDGESPPKTMPLGPGRKFIGPFVMEVNRTGSDDAPPTVTANAQYEIYRGDLEARFRERVAAKDRPENDVLVITTGLVNSRGFVVTADVMIYEFLVQLQSEGLTLQPQHLDQVILHDWGTGNVITCGWRSGAPLLLTVQGT
jgi:hypothetical protein